jgi:hypothetical protein
MYSEKEMKGVTSRNPQMFPKSAYLQATASGSQQDQPTIIFIHPQEQFHLDIGEDSLSISIDHFPHELRFPTYTTFLNCTIAALLHDQNCHYRVLLLMEKWLAGFLDCIVPKPTFNLESLYINKLRPEVRHYFQILVFRVRVFDSTEESRLYHEVKAQSM